MLVLKSEYDPVAPKHQIDGTNSGSRLKVGLTFGTLRKASWLVAKGLVIAEGPRTSRNLTGNALTMLLARRQNQGQKWYFDLSSSGGESVNPTAL